MLDKTVYLKGIKHLNAYYTTFNFNINDDLKVKVWYDSLSAFDNETYTSLIKSYCLENQYAPQSPTHLYEYAKTLEIAKYMNADQAWEYTISLIRHVGYDFSRFYINCEYSIISQVINQIQSEFDGVRTDQLPFIKKTFVKLYNEEIKKHVTIQMREGIGWTTQTLLPKS